MQDGQLGKYIIKEHLGSGAFADVYKAYDPTLNRFAALKLLKPVLAADPRARDAFINEARTMAGLEHPNIAWVYEIGQEEGKDYIAIRYIDGPSLDSLLKEKGPLHWDEALAITHDVAEALQFAHDHGQIHRDVKPGNILVGSKGAVLSDFGLAKSIEGSMAYSQSLGMTVGTYWYMATEIIEGRPACEASDQFSLACTLVEMLTGQSPFHAITPIAVINKHVKGVKLPERWNNHVPKDINQVLLRAFSIDPGQRYQSIQEFISFLMSIDPVQNHATSLQEQNSHTPHADELIKRPDDFRAATCNNTHSSQESMRYLEIGRGYINEHLVTNILLDHAIVKHPFILLFDGVINRNEQILPAIEKLVQTGKKDLVVFAADIDKEALATLIMNKQKGYLNSLGVKLSGEREQTRELIDSISRITGASVFSDVKGKMLKEVTLADLGLAVKIISSKNRSVIIQNHSLTINSGYINEAFISDKVNAQTVIMDPFVLLYDGTIAEPEEIVPLLEKLVRNNHRDFVIFARDVKGDALETLRLNKIRGFLNLLIVKLSSPGRDLGAILHEIAAFTGAALISVEKSKPLDEITLDDLGSAHEIIAKAESTTIYVAEKQRQQSQRKDFADSQSSSSESKFVEAILKNEGSDIKPQNPSKQKCLINVSGKTISEDKFLRKYEILQQKMVDRGVDIDDPSNLMIIEISKALLRISLDDGDNDFMIIRFINQNENLFGQCRTKGSGFEAEISGWFQKYCDPDLFNQSLEAMSRRGWWHPEMPDIMRHDWNFNQVWEEDCDLYFVAKEIFESITEVYRISRLEDFEIKINLE